MDALATVVSNALRNGDLAAMTALLANDVRWGAPEQSVPTCTSNSQVLRWYENAQLAGASADVVETVVLGQNILLGLNVRRDTGPDIESTPAIRWQVMSVEDDKIAEIRGYDSRVEAERFATSGTSNWSLRGQ
jgi:ketosteroid isomerase-like protein